MLRKRTRSMQKDQQACHQKPLLHAAYDFNLQPGPKLQNQRKGSFFNLPGLFVGLGPRALPDLDSASSPTSPLDFKVFPNVANPLRSPRSPHAHDGHQKVWDCDKVGLSIVDSLDHGLESPGKILGSLESKNILLGPQMRIKSQKFGSNSQLFVSPKSFDSLDGKKTVFGPQMRIRSPRFDPQAHIQSPGSPKSLPKNYAFPHTHFKSPLCKGSSNVVFEIGDAPSDLDPFKETKPSHLSSCSQLHSSQLKTDNHSQTNLALVPMSLGSSNKVVGSLSASDIELSEDYTCVTIHGPNPKTTHIYADCVLECQSNNLGSFVSTKEANDAFLPIVDETLETPAVYPSKEFLSLCHMCKKSLEAGKDVYMYRGEQAFCSLECRSTAILNDEEMEKSDCANAPSKNTVLELDDGQELFEADILET